MTKRSRALPAGLVAAAAVLALSSCAAASSVTIEVDYPAYETPASLAREAVVVVEATAVGKEPTVLLPRSEDESDLQVGDTYLLFGTESVDGAFTVLGGSAGAFAADDDRYLATSDAAPVRELTVAEVKALLAGSALQRDA